MWRWTMLGSGSRTRRGRPTTAFLILWGVSKVGHLFAVFKYSSPHKSCNQAHNTRAHIAAHL